MSRTTFSLTCLLWLSWVGLAAAQPQSGAAALNDPGVASLQNFSGGVTFAGSYFQVQNMTGNGVGYQNGFTQLGHMTPFWVNDDFVIASNSRLLITDNGNVGGNIGAFMRYYHGDTDRIFGLNAYYDIDQSIYGNQYRQGGFGIESLGQWFDFRANGYVPTESGDHFIRALTLSDNLTYFGNRVGFLGTGQYEESLWGGDFEVGTPLTPYTPWLRGYAGMYAYHSKGTDPVGVRTRVEGWVADDLNIGVQYTNDKQFGSNVNASVNFLFSGWKPTRWFPNFATRDRMLIPVQRNWRIATGKYEQIDPVAAYNPRTNQPYFITWVDNSAVAPGDGTYEHPLTAMPPVAPNADLILVRVGNTSPLAPLVGNIALSDWQRLLGEGREHQFQAYAQYGALNVPLQTYNLPEFSNTGNYPFLSSLGNTVTLANNNEVSAFNIINALGIGIANTPLGSHNFDLNYLNLRGNLGGGILLQQASGTGLINHIVAQDNLGGGIGVSSGLTPLNLTMDTVVSNSTFPGAQLFGVSIDATLAPITASLTDVTANGNQGGILMSEINSGLTATLRNVNAIGNVGPFGDGIRAAGNGGYMNLDYRDVVATGNGRNGLRITGANTDIQFLGSDINGSGNVGDNLNITLTAGSTFVGSLHDAHFDDSALGSGIVISATSSSLGTNSTPFLIQDVTGNGNFLDGLSVTEAGNAFVNLFVDPSHFDNNGRDGFHFDVTGGSILAATFDQDTLNDNGRSAIFGNVDLAGPGNSLVVLNLTDTPGVRSGADGLFIQSANGAEIHVTSANGDFSDSGQTTPGSSAVRFDADDSDIFLTMNDTFGRNTNGYPGGTQEFGLQLNLTNGTQFIGNVTTGDFSNNLQQGILIDTSNNSLGLLNLIDVAVNGNGADGMMVSVTNGYGFTVNASGTTGFSNNGLDFGAASGNGINVVVDGTTATSFVILDLNGTPINGNRDNGISGDVTGTPLIGAAIQVHTSNLATIDGNGLDGVSFVNTNGIVLANFEDTDISLNGGNGVTYLGTGAGAGRSNINFSHAGINGFFGTTDSNGGDGLNFQVLAGNKLTLSADSVSFSSNNGAGIRGLIDGVGSDVLINTFTQVTADSNFEEGLKLLVDNSAVLNASVNGGSFSFNGISGVFDGVNIVADHNAIATICFDGTVVNSNTGDGFDFAGHNNAQLYVGLQSSGQYGTLSASDNGGQAVVFTLDTGASGGLFMNGATDFTSNQGGNGFTFTASNAARAIFSFTGTADNNVGDGIHVEMTNIAEAYIDIREGSASNNGDNGIDIALDNVTFGAAPINMNFLQGTLTANPFNVSDMVVDNNGSTGIQIVGNVVNMPGVANIDRNEVSGNGVDLLNPVGDGIQITLTGGGTINTLTMDQNTANFNNGRGLNFTATGGYNFNTLSVTNGSYSGNLGNTVDGEGNGIRMSFNGGSVNSLTISGNTVNQNTGFGLGDTADGVLVSATNTTFGAITFDANTVDENEGNGITLAATNSPVNTLTITNNGIHGNVDNGVNLDLVSSPITNLIVTDNDISNVPPLPLLGFTSDIFFEHFTVFNDSDPGIFLESLNYDFSPTVYSVNVSRNALGAPYEIISGGVATGIYSVNGFPVNPLVIVQPGVISNFDTSTTLFWNDFDSTDFLYHGDIVLGDAAATTIPDGTALAGTILTAQFSNGETLVGVLDGLSDTQSFIRPSVPGSANGGDGIRISQVNSSIGGLLFDNNTISGNGGHGINFNTVVNSNIGPTIVSNNTITGNDGDGFHLVNPVTINNNLNLTFTDNNISNNGANGLFQGNGVNGVNLQVGNSHTLNLTMTGNTIDNNLNAGANIVMNGNSVLNATIGAVGPNVNANSFSGNGDAGMSIVMNDNATGGITVQNSNFDNNTNGTGTTFNGVGLGIVLNDNAALNTLHIGDATVMNTTFNGNASHGFQLEMNGTGTIGGQMQLLNIQADGNGGDGVRITLTDTATIPDLLVLGGAINAEISNNTGNGFFISADGSALVTNILVQDVTADSNFSNGLQFFRSGGAQILNTTIDGSTLTNNGGATGLDAGINITAADLNATDTYVITNNTITGNIGQGIRLENIGDADLDVTIANNVISNNTANGILTVQNADTTDTPSLILDVHDNTISGNGASGIAIFSSHLASIDNNQITNNGVDGISIGGSSAFFTDDQITNNTITGNGDDGIGINAAVLFANIDTNTISNNADNGIEIVSGVRFGGDDITINNNLIRFNTGDGIQIAASNGSFNDFTITSNRILDSGARGINIVNAGGTNSDSGSGNVPTDTSVIINNNTIARSGLEGIYVINTADNAQASAAAMDRVATVALEDNGSVFAKPLLSLAIDGNIVNSNGNTHNAGNFIDATGLVLRVGSSDATDNLPSSYTAADTGGTANGGRGGVIATITNNTFSGQYAADVTFQPFISTTDPATTGGTWTDQNTEPRVPADDVFNITSYVQDPLARLDLIFTNNTGQGLVASNFLAATAFYNNDESEFKSRGITGVSSDTTADGAPNFPTTPDDNGPFNSGSRARNATRQTFRGTQPPTIAAGSTFRYSGFNTNNTAQSATNGSTFRIQTGNDATNTFTNVFTSFNTGIAIGSFANGEVPFIWGSF